MTRRHCQDIKKAAQGGSDRCGRRRYGMAAGQVYRQRPARMRHGCFDAIMVPLLARVQVHQRDLLDNAELRKTGIGFDVDYNNHTSVDLAITLALTQRVTVKPAGAGRLEVLHLAEPQPTPAYTAEFWQAYAGDALLAEWQTPANPE